MNQWDGFYGYVIRTGGSPIYAWTAAMSDGLVTNCDVDVYCPASNL